MARREQDREDLLAEATALVERVEIARHAHGEHVVIGFRRDGSASFYFGRTVAIHFNSRGELRRAHVDGELLKAEGRRLVALSRRRAAKEVQLVRHEFTAEQTTKSLADLKRRLNDLRDDLRTQDFQVIGQVPETTDVLSRAQASLDCLIVELKIAQAPHAR
jgi:hypothetical protein